MRVDEDRIDRRFRWMKEAVIGIVLATGWLLRLEWNQKAEHDANAETHKEDKKTHKGFDDSIDDLTHRVIANEKDIEWMKKDCGR